MSIFWRYALLIVCAYGLVILFMLAVDVVKAVWRHLAGRGVDETPEIPRGYRIVRHPYDWADDE